MENRTKRLAVKFSTKIYITKENVISSNKSIDDGSATRYSELHILLRTYISLSELSNCFQKI